MTDGRGAMTDELPERECGRPQPHASHAVMVGRYMSRCPGVQACATEPQPSLAAQIAAGVAVFGEAFEPVLEAVSGYRGKLLAADYPAPIAARMAADYHAALLRTLTSSTSATDEGETAT